MSQRLLLVALVTATLAGLSTEVHAAPTCRQGCRRARVACGHAARAGFAHAKTACVPGAGARDCRSQARRRFRDARGVCGRDYRAACLPCCAAGGASCAGGAPGRLEQTYDVTYNDATVVVDQATVRAHLLGRSDDGATFRFAAAADAVRSLVPGQVVIFAGTALRRVSRVTDTGSEIVVETEPATLAEAIRQGSMGWRYDIAWDRLPAASFTDAVPLVGRTRAAELPPAFTPRALSSIPFSGSIMGWDVEFELTPGPARLDMKLVASRALAGTKAVTVSGTGWISGFTDEMLLTYEDRTPQAMTTKVVGLTGEMELEWHAFKPNDQGMTEITRFALPVKLPITFLVGPVPVTIAVKAELQVVPELRVDQASSGGKFTVTYRSDQGFSVDNGGQAPFGTLHQSTPAVTGDTGSAGWGVVGFGLGVEFPRLELSLFGETAMAFITLKTYSASMFTPGTTLTNDIPPCQMAFTDLFAAAGWQLSFLGWKGPGDTAELWRAPRYEVYGGGKPCSITG